MKGVPVYISDLLYFNDCVIVPGFGGFVADYFPGGKSENGNSFSPPAKRIAFNLHIRENDKMLSGFIVSKEGIREDIVEKKLEDFVFNTYKRLSEGQTIVFEGLGNFFINKDNRLQFVPDSSANFLIDSFGLDSFHFPVIPDKKLISRNIKEQRKSDPVIRATRRYKIRRAVASAPLIAAMVIIPFYSGLLGDFNLSTINPFSTGHKRVEITNHRNNDTVLINPNSVEESILFMTDKKNALFYRQEKKSVPEEKIEIDTVLAEKNEVEIVEVPEERLEEKSVEKPAETTVEKAPEIQNGEFKYHIIAGSLKTNSQAEKIAINLIGKGLEPVILPKDNKGRIRISIGGFNNQVEAIEKLDSIRKNVGIEVWLLTK